MNQQDLDISYHQFGVAEEGADWPADLDAPDNGLASGPGSAVVIFTGIHTGPVSVAVSVIDGPPARLDDSRPWQAITEVSVQAEGDLRVRSLDDETDLPILNPAGPGAYRIRVHAAGRDSDIDGTADVVSEFYLLQVWPAAVTEEVTHRAADQYGRQLRRTPPARATVTDEPDGVTLVEWV